LARALEVAKQLGDPGLIAHMIMERGQCAFEAGEWDEADACCQQTAQLTQHLQWWGAKYLVIFRGILWLAQRPGDVAVRQLESGAALDEQEPDLQASRYAQSALAEWDLLRGSPDRARARLLPLLDRSSEHESDVTRYVLPVLAWAHLESGDETRAEAVVLQSVIRAQAEPNQLALADSLRVQGLVATRQGRWQAAEAALEEALILCRTLPYPYAEAKALYVYGQMRQAKGEPEGARERYEQARAICDRLGEGFYRPHIDRALAALG
jgi:tetratricopeptide (TPR) repeat protein